MINIFLFLSSQPVARILRWGRRGRKDGSDTAQGVPGDWTLDRRHARLYRGREPRPPAEPWRQLFRGLRYREAEGPGKICSRLRELCRRWLEPQHRSKEQMLELVVLEQFLAILPPEMRSCVCRCRVETCAQAVALAEGFQLGEVEDEKLQVTVRVKVEEGSSDKMQPVGALPEPGDSWGQQPKARGEDRPLEEAEQRETPGPEDELPHVTKEEPPPNPEPGAGTLSRADQQPPKEGPVNLELQRPSPGTWGQSGSLTPGLGQLQEGQGRPAKQGESMELREAFGDVAMYFTREEWELLEEEDKGLYRDQMLRNHQTLVSLVFCFVVCSPNRSQPAVLHGQTLKTEPVAVLQEVLQEHSSERCLLVSMDAGRDIAVENLLRQELCTVPLSLTTTDQLGYQVHS
ncbi:hypothetical protein Y1Q_0013032 [Alligator mississippiensis]|uniref:Zinc finger protein 202-like n=1 Tax=Alligator mississippiensis TaxID=8496 RepID=A0A151NVS3_ALLMI|nr:hypothetical protein Y1Q_0013032 [Alligator mississippiensis]